MNVCMAVVALGLHRGVRASFWLTRLGATVLLAVLMYRLLPPQAEPRWVGLGPLVLASALTSSHLGCST